ncbi:hypothetical protein Psch_01481 [Pelotomaculum schinkii]|uniref:Uncharacterized protein n=1 Tax=Pelotomaculum schinkii TaxID=78350 RepID=A0A4Y7RGI5_9FIRM|nr:hypothetical protein [Pelotomaculum schinkii]TEB07926.1 hypothetical protein Psch_01481 [Pelotomaculum schinkii]
MEYINSKLRIFIITAIILFIFLSTPYAVNYLILPGKYDPKAEYFNGEWFNKIKPISADQYKILIRWAHYYGNHRCEPEWSNCPYNGVDGQWKLMFDYIREDKPLPADLIKSKT